MPKVLFGQSYYLKFDPKLWAAMQPYPPLGTLYAASFIRERGYQAALFDAMLAESEEEWAAALDRERPDFAVIYEDNFNYLSKMCLLRMRQAAFTMIGMARQRGCVTIMCGSDATDHAEQYLKQGADFVLLGEGEVTLAELLDRLTGRTETPFGEILGLAYKEGETVALRAGRQGEISPPPPLPPSPPLFRRNARRPDIKDVDTLPFPAWDLVDVDRYRKIWLERHGFYSMNMVTTRGCPYHCNWCAKPIWGQRYNSRSPENVVTELKWLKETYRPDHVWFADDIMGLKPGWWQRFADQVEQQEALVPFKCLSRADLVVRSDKDVDGLRRAGCNILWMGAESGSQKILNAMEKGTKVEQIVEATRRLHAAGIRVGFFLQFGYPGETRQDIERTLQMVRDCLPDDVGMSVSYALPGTKFYENVRLQLGEKQNWLDSADLAMMYNGPFTTVFYRQLHVVLHKEFRSRRGWVSLRRVLPHPWQLRPAHLREAVAIVYRLGTLPLERAKLDRLARIPHQGVAPMPHMSLEEAARPTPQSEG
ncbi:MAG: B12-binding domain-containing radical SAM protein [Chloroflexi bacterium]|nr:B12-binding domain-containing radical SAM protein [Chloroflexota bacterium]MCI0576670.1 B12-binding domain-containing radical SAM protein [Chloroflexota bacterium]MCI0647983.1 B12-binding domain-containing radical SAM protein [Chloroflexota bacterium]MCI0726807.1 B12-binding domain-containing radical SAM protein [Chloroflexota bacterium]